MADRDDDLTFESTTDTPEQIAEGLGLDPVEPTEEPGDGDVAVEAAAGEEPVAEVVETDEAEEPVGEVTAHPHKATAPRKAKASRPQAKAVAGAAAAARRASDAKLKVAEAERDAALERVKELAAGRQPVAATTRTAPVEKVVTADQIPDTHPDIQAVRAKITALGPKPKQEDFTDFAEFEDKKDQWLEDRAFLRGREATVREDVARRETIATTEANRAAQATATAFEQSVAAAKGRHADYDDQMEAARTAGITVGSDVGTALMESAIGADVAYYLVTHPAEVERINALSPHRQIAEVGILEGRIAAAMRSPAPITATRPSARLTRAPEPQGTVLGDLSGTAKTKDINDPSLTQAEYNRMRDQMDRDSGRRTH